MERDETIGGGGNDAARLTETVSGAGVAVHENARGCTVSAGADDGAGAGVHENARKCTVSDDDGGEGDADVGPEGQLSDRQRAAIEFLVLGRSFTAVARELGVNPSTLYRWRREEPFAAALARRRDEVWDGMADRLRALVRPAIDVLDEQVHDVYDRSRMWAADRILRFTNLGKSIPPGYSQRG